MESPQFTLEDAWIYRDGHLMNCAAKSRMASARIPCSNGCKYRKFYRWLRIQYQNPSDHDYMTPEEMENSPV